LNVLKNFSLTRVPALLLVVSTMAACSPNVELPPLTYVTPTTPTAAAATDGIKKAVAEEKLVSPVEVAELRETDHGPGHFISCIRGLDSTYRRLGYYAAFFDNNDYKGTRRAVLIDDCEKQEYRPSP
jgi:hypothetical protein